MKRLLLFVALICITYAPAWAGDGHHDDHDLKVYSGAIDDDIFAAAESVNIDGVVAGDVFAAGGWINIAGTLADELVVAGAEVSSRADVGNDVLAVGRSLYLGGSVGDNLLAAGGSVTITGSVDGKAIVTGGQVNLDRHANIVGDAWLGGARVRMGGAVQGNLKIAAGKAIILGTVGGNVTVEADELVIGPGVHIAGNVTLKGPKAPEISKDAVIDGKVSHMERAGFDAMADKAKSWLAVASVMSFVWLIIIGIAILLILPRGVQNTAREFTARPLSCLGLGILLLFGAPLLFVFLCFTVIGMPLGLIGLAFYLIALLLAVPLAGVATARMILSRKGGTPTKLKIIGVYILLLAGFTLLGWVPFVGGFIWAAVMAMGFGGGCLTDMKLLRPYMGET